jgi:RimJ/RimL family protein N-acetyltransferase
MFDINQVKPLFQFECDEPGGVVTRQVRQLTLDLDTLQHFWLKAKEFPTLFAQEVNDDFGQFCEIFITKLPNGKYVAKGLLWLIDDWVGVLYLTDIYPDEATVHYTFFDRRQKGRLNLVKAMIYYVFKKYQFNRLNASLPLFVKPYSFEFVNKLGFKSEGRKRQSVMHKGQFFDEALFGLLKSEVLETNGRKD